MIFLPHYISLWDPTLPKRDKKNMSLTRKKGTFFPFCKHCQHLFPLDDRELGRCGSAWTVRFLNMNKKNSLIIFKSLQCFLHQFPITADILLSIFQFSLYNLAMFSRKYREQSSLATLGSSFQVLFLESLIFLQTSGFN